MRKTTIVWSMIAVLIVLVGCFLVKGLMVKYETNTYEIGKVFSDISITIDAADIIFALSDDGTCKVECYEEESARHSVTVENDVLVVRINKSWYDYIGFSFGSPKITVYLPKAEYDALSIRGSTGSVEIPNDYLFENVDISLSTGDVDFCASVSKLVKIKATTGNICVEDASAGALDLSVTTGKVTVSGVNCRDDITVGVSTGQTYLTDISCESVISCGTTGSISLSNVIATNRFSIKRSTGDICVEGASAGALDLSVTTGKVTVSEVTCRDDITVGVSTGQTYLTDISCKSIISSGTAGSISLSNVIATNGFSIERNTGDVKFSGCDANVIYVKTTTGNVTGSFLSNKVFITNTHTGSVDVPKTATGGRCEISTHTGDIKIRIEL